MEGPCMCWHICACIKHNIDLWKYHNMCVCRYTLSCCMWCSASVCVYMRVLLSVLWNHILCQSWRIWKDSASWFACIHVSAHVVLPLLLERILCMSQERAPASLHARYEWLSNQAWFYSACKFYDQYWIIELAATHLKTMLVNLDHFPTNWGEKFQTNTLKPPHCCYKKKWFDSINFQDMEFWPKNHALPIGNHQHSKENHNPYE